MTALALALAIASANAPPAPATNPVGRVYTSSFLHVGVRPAFLATPDELAAAFTVQVTANVF